MSEDAFLKRIATAVAELAKGMKTVSFYPAGHPSLIQAISRIIAVFEEIPLPETGLEIDVTKNALAYGDASIPVTNKSISDLNRELYLRRASKIIVLPGLKPDEVVAFLSVLNRDNEQIQDEGGLERVLIKEKVSHIWANRVDYEGLTEMLKKESAEEQGEDEQLKTSELSFDLEALTLQDEETIDSILARIEKETNPSAYRDHIIAFTRALFNERMDRKIEYASRALSIFASHIERPPRQNEEIASLARLGIKEMATDELVSHYIRLLQDRGRRGQREVETVLVAFEERAVKPLFQALADEEDLLVRKSIVDIVIKIGRPAVPIVLDYLNDSRWYMVRNVVTILGSFGLPDVAPHVATALAHPDLRVKKEAIKALSKLPHPFAVTSLGELCFFPEESVALTATAALSAKKENEAVLSLYRRIVHRSILYPSYRLAHEAIDSLRAIGTDEALTALEDVLHAKAVWETKRFRDMKTHALRSISKLKLPKVGEALQKAHGSPRKYLRDEAAHLLHKLGERGN